MHFLFFSIDATKETGDLGRLCNHVLDKHANAKMKILNFDGEIRVALFAKVDINEGDEIKWDYKDTSAKSIASFPFLR